MFDLQCMQYLKEISQNPRNISLRDKLFELIHQNPDKVEPFIEKFQLNVEQKQLLLELLQETQNNNSNSPQNPQFSQQTSQQNQISSNNDSNEQKNPHSSEKSLYDIVFEYFTSWRDEYLKYQKITQQCVDIVERMIQQYLWFNQNNADTFISLPTQQNDAFVKFKNHTINILCVHIIEQIDREITLLRSSSIPFITKYILLFKFEKLENIVKKKKIEFIRLQSLQQESLRSRNKNT